MIWLHREQLLKKNKKKINRLRKPIEVGNFTSPVVDAPIEFGRSIREIDDRYALCGQISRSSNCV